MKARRHLEAWLSRDNRPATTALRTPWGGAGDYGCAYTFDGMSGGLLNRTRQGVARGGRRHPAHEPCRHHTVEASA